MAISEQPRAARRGLAAWSTRDLLVLVVIALVFGLITAPLFTLSPIIDATLGPVLKRLTSGIFLVPSLLAAYTLRRPGAALLCAVLVGLVQVPFTPLGLILVFGQAVFGILYELPFLIARYRRYGLTMMLVSGAVLGLILGAIDFVPNGGPALAPLAQVMFIVLNTLSGALGGLLAKWLADTIARSGAFGDRLGTTREV